MLIAKIENHQIIRIDDYRAFNFKGIPTEKHLEETGFKKVNLWRPHNHETQRLVPSEPTLEGNWVYLVKVENID